MNVQRFTKKIKVVYFDGITDVQEIANWCGGMVVELVTPEGRVRNDMYCIDIPCPGGFTTAGANFYIFEDNGSFFSMDKISFESNFDTIGV